jgi:Zn-dependent protease with chaperone function
MLTLGISSFFRNVVVTYKINFLTKPPTPGSLLTLIFLFACLSLGAQVKDFSPAPQDEVYLSKLSAKYLQQYKTNLNKLPAQNKQDLVDAYQHRWENIKEKFDKKEIYTSKAAQDYLDRLVSAIRQGNPVLANMEVACYFSRSDIPNAAYIGEGIILFNMGLFIRLDDESQAVFVLCHELAHYILRHSENSIQQYVSTINSEEVQAQLRKIKRSEYQKHEQVQTLVKGLTFDSRRHSRDHEAQADSMAVELMRNTKFDLSGALSTLALLDVIDTDTLNTSSCLPRVFNSPEYPFRKKWIVRSTGLLGDHALITDSTMADSLKTHPDCVKRIGLLTVLMKGWKQPGAVKFGIDPATFTSLKNIFRCETIEYAFLTDNYTRSLFLTLELLQKDPDDAYLVAQTGRLLNGIYGAQKGHTLSKVTDLPSPAYPSNYNLLLQFMQNLYLEDVAAIDYYYLKKHHPQLDGYALFKAAFEQSERQMKN